MSKQYTCSSAKIALDIATLDRVQRRAARFVTGNYDQTMSVPEMLQDLKWDTLETIRRHSMLCTIYKMCPVLLDGDWADYLITSRERRTRGSHDLNLLYRKDIKIFLDFLSFPVQ